MRRSYSFIALVILLLVFSPLTALSAEGASFFSDWFEGSSSGGSSEKRRVADDRDFDVDEKSPARLASAASGTPLKTGPVHERLQDCGEVPEFLFSVGDSAEDISVRGSLNTCPADDDRCVEKKGPLYSFSIDDKKTTVMGVVEPCVNLDRETVAQSREVPYFVADASSHRRSNYSLGEYPKKPLPDCSEFIDPKDAEKYSHCHGVVGPVEKWQGYLEFLGKPGTARNLGQSDLFVPLNQDENDMTFFNLRGQMDDNDTSEYNVGIGHRHMFENWILGGYGYFDHRFTDFGNSFKQVTFGVEALSEDWDIRGNGYIPENKTVTVVEEASDVRVVRPGDQIKLQVSGVVEETALAGFDGEVGYRLPLSKILPKKVNDLEWFEDTRLYMGGYHFIGEGNFESVSGPRVRLETRVHDLPILGNGSRLMLGLESQYDEPRGSQTFGLVQLRIPFGALDNRRRVPALKGLDRRMMQPVVRDVDVVAPTFEDAPELAPLLNENGEEITVALDVEMSADCDEDCMQDKLTTMMGNMDEDTAAVIFIKGMETNTVEVDGEKVTVMDWDDMNVGGALAESQMIVASAGKDWNVTYDSERIGTGVVTHNEEGTPVGTEGSCWTLSEGAQIQGWTVTDATGCSGNGIMITGSNEAVYHISNTTVTGSAGNGLYVNNALAVVNVNGLSISNSNSVGARVDAGELVGENIVIDTTGTHGLYVNGALAVANVNDISISNSNFVGARADAGGRIFAENISIDNIRNHGVRADGENSKIVFTGDISDSVFANSVTNTRVGYGLYATNGGEIDVEDIEISGNVYGVATHQHGHGNKITVRNGQIFDNDFKGVVMFSPFLQDDSRLIGPGGSHMGSTAFVYDIDRDGTVDIPKITGTNKTDFDSQDMADIYAYNSGWTQNEIHLVNTDVFRNGAGDTGGKRQVNIYGGIFKMTGGSIYMDGIQGRLYEIIGAPNYGEAPVEVTFTDVELEGGTYGYFGGVNKMTVIDRPDTGFTFNCNAPSSYNENFQSQIVDEDGNDLCGKQ